MRPMLERVRRIARVQRRAAANALAKRTPERPRETHFGDYVLSYPSRSLIGRAVAEGLIWDFPLVEIVERLPRNGVVCEVGSNIGASLLTMAATRDDLEFICFEPSPRFVPYLRRNVERNGLAGRVTIEPQLVGPEGREWKLTSNTSTGSVSAGGYDGHIPLSSRTFRSVSLDCYFGDAHPPSLIKVDTDGFELKVLVSARRILKEARPDLFVEYAPTLLERIGDGSDALRNLLLWAGYSQVDIYSSDGSLIERDRTLSVPMCTDSYFDLFLRGSS